MNKITKQEYPTLFKNYGDCIIDESYSEHRRGSNFFTQSIIEFTKDDIEFHPEIEDFTPFIGTWETNVYISDTEYGTEWSEITELTRVTKETIVVTTTKWMAVK